MFIEWAHRQDGAVLESKILLQPCDRLPIPCAGTLLYPMFHMRTRTLGLENPIVALIQHAKHYEFQVAIALLRIGAEERSGRIAVV